MLSVGGTANTEEVLEVKPSTKVWVGVLVAGIVGLAVGFALGWALQRQNVTDAASEAAVLKAKTTGLQLSVDKLTKDLATSQAELQALKSSEPTPPVATTTKPTPKPPGESGRKFGYVKKVAVRHGGPGTSPFQVSFDEAVFLTGEAAAAAAAARGDESPPPNDYYIVNDTSKITSYPVASACTVTLAVTPDGWNADGLTGTLDDFSGMFRDPASPLAHGKSAPWWYTLKKGVIVKLEQQYVP